MTYNDLHMTCKWLSYDLLWIVHDIVNLLQWLAQNLHITCIAIHITCIDNIDNATIMIKMTTKTKAVSRRPHFADITLKILMSMIIGMWKCIQFCLAQKEISQSSE